MRLTMIIALLSIASSTFAGSASLRHTIELGRSEGRSFLEIDISGPSSMRVQEAVSRAILASADPDVVVTAVARSLAVPRMAAAALIEAHVRNTLTLSGGHDDIETAEHFARIALRSAPQSPDVVAFLLSLAPGMADDEFATAYLPFVRALPRAGDAAIVASGLTFGGNRAVIIIADALQREPDNPNLQEVLTHQYDAALQATFGPVRFDGRQAALRESWRKVEPNLLAVAAASQIAALGRVGRAADVIADFDVLPQGTRDAIASGNLRQDNQPLDVRLTLGYSALLCGDVVRAKLFIANVHAVKSNEVYPQENQLNELRVLQALLAPRLEEDVYEILADAINSGARPSGGIWSAVFAALASRGGYPSVGAAALRNANRWDRDDMALIARKYLPDALRAQLQVTLDRNTTSIAALRTVVSNRGEDQAVLKRLSAPRMKLFDTKKLPSSVASSTAVVIDCGDKRIATMHIPAGWYPIRLEQNGEEVSGIAISQALDPSGEVGRGAYWLLHSCNRGQTWDAPLYSGLRENAPYVVLPASNLQLMHGDHLEVEVDYREIDPESITFPPVALRVKREEHGLYLELPWEALRRDSDGDGITDLVEERIATDPDAADSDGDGIPDGNDGLPLVRLTASGQAAESEVLAAVLRAFQLGGGASIIGLPSTEDEQKACVVRASVVGEGALFLIGDRDFYAPIDINRRVIVLTRAEMDAYEEKFGPTYGADLSFIIVRHDGKKALVVLNESWKEDVLELTKTKEGWKVAVVGGWIS
jgi:hypothetical protein